MLCNSQFTFSQITGSQNSRFRWELNKFCLLAEILVLGGSIPKYVTGECFPGVTNNCIPGASIAQVIDAVMFDRQLVTRYDAVLVHMGTYNVVPGSTASGVASQYRFLIQAVKHKFPDATICRQLFPSRAIAGQSFWSSWLMNWPAFSQREWDASYCPPMRN